MVFLEESVLDFALQISPLTEEQLETPWAWASYSGEGVRFAVFRVYEELLQLAAGLGPIRKTPRSEAQRILGQYHLAYRDLQGALWGVNDHTGVMQPGDGEWPVQIALAHLVQADLAFYAVLAYALERHAAGDDSPGPPDDADYDRILEATDEDYAAIEQMSVSELQIDLLEYHERTLRAFAGIPDDLLDKPSRYWEEEPYPIRFRLLRFGSHMRQHTVQIDKILTAIGKGPTEAARLVRMLLNALAEVENQTLGARRDSPQLVSGTATVIKRLTEEVRQALSH